MFACADIPKHSATYYEAIKPEVQEAQRKGAKFKVIYHIVDDELLLRKRAEVRHGRALKSPCISS